jgi:hypothetical protein
MYASYYNICASVQPVSQRNKCNTVMRGTFLMGTTSGTLEDGEVVNAEGKARIYQTII